MSPRQRTDRRDPHATIDAWLIEGAEEDLPRDLAVHASLCPDCRMRIAAFDMLAAVKLDQAGFPPLRAAALGPAGPRRGVALAAGGVVAVSAVATVAAVMGTSWRPSPDTVGGAATERPTQAVLGNTGQPQPTARSASQTPSGTPTASPTATSIPLPTAAPVVTPPPTGPASLPAPTPTLRPTHAPTATPRPSASPAATATPSPTPVITPEPPTPTPEPTPTPTP